MLKTSHPAVDWFLWTLEDIDAKQAAGESVAALPMRTEAMRALLGFHAPTGVSHDCGMCTYFVDGEGLVNEPAPCPTVRLMIEAVAHAAPGWKEEWRAEDREERVHVDFKQPVMVPGQRNDDEADAAFLSLLGDPSEALVSLEPVTSRLSTDAAVVLAVWRSHLVMERAYRTLSLDGMFAPYLGNDDERAGAAVIDLMMAGVLEVEEELSVEKAETVSEMYLRLVPCRTRRQWVSLPTRARPKIGKEIRQQVYIRDRGKCRYCGDLSLSGHLDHVVPHVAGGETSLENLVLACVACNSSKHSNVWVPMPVPAA